MDQLRHDSNVKPIGEAVNAKADISKDDVIQVIETIDRPMNELIDHEPSALLELRDGAHRGKQMKYHLYQSIF